MLRRLWIVAVLAIALDARAEVPVLSSISTDVVDAPFSLGAVAEHEVQPNVLGVADAGLLDQPPELTFHLPDGSKVDLAIRRFQPLEGFMISKEGDVVREVDPAKLSYNVYAVGKGAEATIAVNHGIMSAVLSAGRSTLSVASTGGIQVLRVLDVTKFPTELHDLPVSDHEPVDKVTPSDLPRPKNSIDHVDVLVLHTNNALAVAGGQGALDALVQNSILDMNTALENSMVISTQVRNVNPGGAQTLLVNYNESPGIADVAQRWYAHRIWARTDPQATVDPVTGRNANQADLVVLLVGDAGVCGVAYTQRPNCGAATGEPGCGVGAAYNAFAVSVVSTACAVQTRTFAHEVGHQYGMEHDPPNGVPGGSASFLWSYGHTVSNAAVQVRTIMAYETPGACPFGCPVALHYSNPTVDFQVFPGTPSGSPVPDGQGRFRFNARTAAALSEAMVNYRGPAITDRVFRSSFEALPDF